MRMLVLGAGLQGSACAYDLLRQPGVERVTIADLKPERIPAFLKPHLGKRRPPLQPHPPAGAPCRPAAPPPPALPKAAPPPSTPPASRATAARAAHCPTP